MAEFDTVIKNAIVGAAADLFFEADLGISGGVNTAIRRNLGPACRDFDAEERYVLPGAGPGRIRRLVGHNHFTILEELADGATCSAVANGADTNN